MHEYIIEIYQPLMHLSGMALQQKKSIISYQIINIQSIYAPLTNEITISSCIKQQIKLVTGLKGSSLNSSDLRQI
ncbi:hypothetical protein pb186bvf_001771 [Paramecium bursaria]